MNKLIFTLSVAMLFNALPTQNMEKELTTNEQNNSDCPLPDFKLEDELIFACCVTQEVSPKKGLTESQKAFNNSIKNFMNMRATCQSYRKSLTYEKIGNFCKNHRCFTKKQTLRNFSDTLRSYYITYKLKSDLTTDYTTKKIEAKYLTKTEEYDSSIAIFRPALPHRLDFRCRMRMLILLHTLVNENNNSSLLPQLEHWLTKALVEDDTCMIEALFKSRVTNPNTLINGSPLFTSANGYPLFFFSKTVEVIQLCIKHGADLHATLENPTYNVLTYIKNALYLSEEKKLELTTFYLDKGVKELEFK